MSVPKRIPVKKSTATWAGPISIRKRSGDVVPFDAGKIREAIRKAHVATREEVLPPGAIDELARRVVRAIPSGQIPTVEQVPGPGGGSADPGGLCQDRQGLYPLPGRACQDPPDRRRI